MNEITYAVFHTLKPIIPEYYEIRPHRIQQIGRDVLRIQHKGKSYYWELSINGTLVHLTFKPKQQSATTHSFIVAELCDPDSLDHLSTTINRLLTGRDEDRKHHRDNKGYIALIDELLAEPISSSEQYHAKAYNMRTLIEDALGRLKRGS